MLQKEGMGQALVSPDPAVRILVQHLSDQVLGRVRGQGEARVAEVDGIVANRVGQLVLILAVEGIALGYEHVEHDAAGPDIDWLFVRVRAALVLEDLRRHEVRRPQDVPRLSSARTTLCLLAVQR